ncbi:hypothetical protein BJ742DRAFT_828680 [Cladochytrium replicatum]|nr:hypothetical protein BJ742DRAFT_828680 [Cladochytrium replicatum]
MDDLERTARLDQWLTGVSFGAVLYSFILSIGNVLRSTGIGNLRRKQDKIWMDHLRQRSRAHSSIRGSPVLERRDSCVSASLERRAICSAAASAHIDQKSQAHEIQPTALTPSPARRGALAPVSERGSSASSSASAAVANKSAARRVSGLGESVLGSKPSIRNLKPPTVRSVLLLLSSSIIVVCNSLVTNANVFGSSIDVDTTVVQAIDGAIIMASVTSLAIDRYCSVLTDKKKRIGSLLLLLPFVVSVTVAHWLVRLFVIKEELVIKVATLAIHPLLATIVNCLIFTPTLRTMLREMSKDALDSNRIESVRSERSRRTTNRSETSFSVSSEEYSASRVSRDGKSTERDAVYRKVNLHRAKTLLWTYNHCLGLSVTLWILQIIITIVRSETQFGSGIGNALLSLIFLLESSIENIVQQWSSWSRYADELNRVTSITCLVDGLEDPSVGSSKTSTSSNGFSVANVNKKEFLTQIPSNVLSSVTMSPSAERGISSSGNLGDSDEESNQSSSSDGSRKARKESPSSSRKFEVSSYFSFPPRVSTSQPSGMSQPSESFTTSKLAFAKPSDQPRETSVAIEVGPTRARRSSVGGPPSGILERRLVPDRPVADESDPFVGRRNSIASPTSTQALQALASAAAANNKPDGDRRIHRRTSFSAFSGR